jgi:hypothetical protein
VQIAGGTVGEMGGDRLHGTDPCTLARARVATYRERTPRGPGAPQPPRGRGCRRWGGQTSSGCVSN